MNGSYSSGRIRGREPNRLDWFMLLASFAIIGWILLGH
jgi:hypothetical protein